MAKSSEKEEWAPAAAAAAAASSLLLSPPLGSRRAGAVRPLLSEEESFFLGDRPRKKGMSFQNGRFFFVCVEAEAFFFFKEREREREKKSTSLFPSSLSPTRVLLRFVFSLFFSPPFFSLVSLFLPPPRGSQCSAAPSRRDTSPSSMPWGRSRCSCGRRMVRGGV